MTILYTLVISRVYCIEHDIYISHNNSNGRVHSGNGYGQWEKALHCNASSHWLSPCPEWSLQCQKFGQTLHSQTIWHTSLMQWILTTLGKVISVSKEEVKIHKNKLKRSVTLEKYIKVHKITIIIGWLGIHRYLSYLRQLSPWLSLLTNCVISFLNLILFS